MQEYSRPFTGEYPPELRWEPGLTESIDTLQALDTLWDYINQSHPEKILFQITQCCMSDKNDKHDHKLIFFHLH